MIRLMNSWKGYMKSCNPNGEKYFFQNKKGSNPLAIFKNTKNSSAVRGFMTTLLSQAGIGLPVSIALSCDFRPHIFFPHYF